MILPRGGGGIGKIGRLRRSVEKCSQLTGDAPYRLTVGEVRSNGDVPDLIIKIQHGLDVSTRDGILLQDENAVNASTFIPSIINTQFFTRAEHTVGGGTEKLTIFNGNNLSLSTIHSCAMESNGDVVTCMNIGGAGHDLNIFAISPAVDMANLQMLGILHFFNSSEFTHYNAAHIGGGAFFLLNFQTAGEQGFFNGFVIDAC